METDLSLKDSPRRWWLMVLLVSAMVVCYAHRGALSIAAPFMMRELGFSPAAMGILLSGFFWSYSLMQIPAGWLVDRYGVKRAYAVGYLFWSAASALTGFAGSLFVLLAIRVLVGVGQAVAFPASARAVANWFPDKERGIVTASYLTGARLGQILLSSVGTFFLAAYGLKPFFLVTGIIPMLWLLWWLRFLSPQESSSEAVPNPRAERDGNLSFIGSVALLKHRSVFGIFLGFFAYDYTWFVYLTWLPGYLVIERKFSVQEMAIYSSIPYAFMSLIILLSGFISDALVRRGYSETVVRKTLIAAGLGICCLIVPAGLVKDKMTAVWLLTISLSGLGIASPNTWTLTQAVSPKNLVGVVSGIQNFGGNLGGVIAPALTGYIAHKTQSFALALALTGAILIVGLLSYTVLVSEKVEIGKSKEAL